jgi:hypothetical protein
MGAQSLIKRIWNGQWTCWIFLRSIEHKNTGRTRKLQQVDKAYLTHNSLARQWLTSIILATQEIEIRKLTVQGQPRQKVSEILVAYTCHPMQET